MKSETLDVKKFQDQQLKDELASLQKKLFDLRSQTVTEKVKEIDLGANYGSPLRVPLASTKIAETDSIVRVSDGNIVAIGGLMSEVQRRDRSGLPGTSGNAFLSGIFGQNSTKFRKRELVILLRPTVIQDENTWRQDLMDTQTRVQTYDPRPYLPK